MFCSWLTLSVVVRVAVMVTPGGRYGVIWRPSAGGSTAHTWLSYMRPFFIEVQNIYLTQLLLTRQRGNQLKQQR